MEHGKQPKLRGWQRAVVILGFGGLAIYGLDRIVAAGDDIVAAKSKAHSAERHHDAKAVAQFTQETNQAAERMWLEFGVFAIGVASSIGVLVTTPKRIKIETATGIPAIVATPAQLALPPTAARLAIATAPYQPNPAA